MPTGIYPLERRKNLFKKGHKHPKYILDKISKSNMGHKPPKSAFKKGQHSSPETEFKRGEKSPNWKGGKSYEIYPVDWTLSFRESIRERDNYVCFLCGISQYELIGRFKKLDIHHIDYDKNNLNPNNLISLCRTCHMKTNYNREYWIEQFGDTWKTVF